MIKRSRLFATVAFPVLSVSLVFEPALAESLKKPFEIAQEESIQAPDGEQAPEELLRKKHKKREQVEEQPQEAQPEQQQAAPEQQPAEEPQEKPRRRKQRDAEPQPEAQPEQQQEAQPAEEQPAPSEKKHKKRQDAEQPAAEQPKEAQPTEEQPAKPQENKRRKQRDAEQQEQQPAAEEKPAQAEPAQNDGADKATQERRKKAREEKLKRQKAEEQQQEAPTAKPTEQAPADEAKPAIDDATKAAEERKRAREERRKLQDAEQNQEQPATGDQAKPATDGELRPAIDGENAEGRKPGDRRKPRPEVKDTRTEAEKEKIAEDPSKTSETVVLPTDNGAAVLDSDKDADNRGGNDAREHRRKQREQTRVEEDKVEVPKSDAEAQSKRRDRRPTREELGEAINEKGRRIDTVPEFGLPDLIDAFTGNNRERPRIEEGRNNRTVIDFGDQVIVRSDDRPRLRRDARDTYYEELPRGRTREVIERGDGVRVVTIYNRYGDIVQRSRIDQDGREYLMIYAPEADEGPRPPMVDVGDDLPPMRLRVPVRDYIIDTSSQPDRDYYDFLAEPPVEQVERTYTIDEVKNSARIRDKVRRIDLDTITFATGSAEVPLSQAKTLRKVADAMLEVIDKDPGETFFIEGHTDAVGSDDSNLVLSDERAESVASLLSEVYDIPPENLVTQGYGERYLKIRTDGAEQQNRRVTIRRVTPLVRPVAQN
ncbi:outer membrane protein OmpA-like peptidoglycan-associated protein [Pararhizobium capsulatum DSM 1112]|uniref:Outer membrane protein OmpA-like peptidoglycan-associated protein n=1 Tax=Pararhizobium capsulatum DSM 1112 TaxID=1121113 RepID=A0ABU0BQS8_9HYPH|nr:OmpA family protein [Pararhizobium capsulatum]MDQ0320593.1 outer membrane protein OmpA-like peptidoglycan-associated protein [Pararhizobium capsulatum DSM 1112]